ncbi:unnamed protein product [Orchesella dallaii]|uniref:Lipocalin/cytosolic fatty-acid binding domain-containing protein n=1 Tax=Orchesella dallaii TaxID=48710 RepID=A0ABP1QVA1_9HEXA
MTGIVGTYELVSSEKYDDFLKAAGVSMIQRSMASRVTPIMSWSHENGKWTQEMKTPLKSWQIVFTEGEEFEEELAGGRKCQSVITFEGNTLVHKQSEKLSITREQNYKVS